MMSKGERANYPGVLVPPETYKNMHIDIFQKNDFQQQLEKCRHDEESRALDPIEVKNSPWLYLAEGIIIGGIGSLYLTHGR